MNQDDSTPAAALDLDDHRLLRVLSTGLSAAEAADLLSMSLPVVAVQLAQIRRALNVTSTAAAIHESSRRRL